MPLTVKVSSCTSIERKFVPWGGISPHFDVVAIASPANAERVACQRQFPYACAPLDAPLSDVAVGVVSVVPSVR